MFAPRPAPCSQNIEGFGMVDEGCLKIDPINLEHCINILLGKSREEKHLINTHLESLELQLDGSLKKAPTPAPALPLEMRAVGSRQRAVSSSGQPVPPPQAPSRILSSVSHSDDCSDVVWKPMDAKRKVERSISVPASAISTDNNNNRPSKSSNINPSRYKTEMCRPFEETGHCKYGDKCQFAHGSHELRNLARHPKYKTDLCRTFHTIGFCPYGPRCHFIHSEDDRKLTMIVQQKRQQAAQEARDQMLGQSILAQQLLQQQFAAAAAAAAAQVSSANVHPPRPAKLITSIPPGFTRNSLGSLGDSPSTSPTDSITSGTPQSLSPTSGMGDVGPQFAEVFTRPYSTSTPVASVNTASPPPPMSPLNVHVQQHQYMNNLCNNGKFSEPPSPPQSEGSVNEEVEHILRLPFFSQLSTSS